MAKFTLADIQAPHAISVMFKAVLALFDIHIEAGPGGSVNPVGDLAVPQGSTLVLDIVPDAGFELDVILLDGNPVQPDAE